MLMLLRCACIALNALTAGGIFCFPLIAPWMASELHRTQSQLSLIPLAGMMGQYPFAPLFGTLLDRTGPWACSFFAFVSFAVSYGVFGGLMAGRNTDAYFLFPILFFVAGLGTVSSYFSCLFSAIQTFPDSTGLATGVVTALFGLSPLFLSTIASAFFTNESGNLDAPRYILCLAILMSVSNLLGSWGLRAPSSAVDHFVSEREADESSPLLPGEEPALIEHSSIGGLLKDVDFLLLGSIMLVCMGSAEMVMSNIGTIITSITPFDPSVAVSSATIATQVRLISIANTISRLVTGPLADFTSPIPHDHSMEHSGTLRRRRVTRLAFVCAGAGILLVCFVWGAAGISTANGVFGLSVGTGAAYGMLWTVIPSINDAVWGSQHAARNFGVISYAPFFGTPLFTLLYARISDAHRGGGEAICRGAGCWQPTFAICAGSVAFAGLLSFVLVKRLRAKV